MSSFDLSNSDLSEHRPSVKGSKPEDVKSVLWFVPNADHVLRGGIRTAVDAAQYLQDRGVVSSFCVCQEEPESLEPLRQSLREHFPALRAEFFDARWGEAPAVLPNVSVGVCTLWTTAYSLLRHRGSRRKVYLVQDWEPYFYPAGTESGLIEQTYRFGFDLLANSPGVERRCREVSDKVAMFRPGVDHSIFFPAAEPRPAEQYRVVFYGRPGRSRNGFDLGAAALRRVKATLGGAVEIISVGADYDPAAYGLEGIVTNYGLLGSMSEVAELYRSCDVGLIFMFSAHPSYQPLEFMASGCVTVTNDNVHNRWLLQTGRNCVVVPIAATAVAAEIVDLLKNPGLRSQISAVGYETAASLPWESSIAEMARLIGSPDDFCELG